MHNRLLETSFQNHINNKPSQAEEPRVIVLARPAKQPPNTYHEFVLDIKNQLILWHRVAHKHINDGPGLPPLIDSLAADLLKSLKAIHDKAFQEDFWVMNASWVQLYNSLDSIEKGKKNTIKRFLMQEGVRLTQVLSKVRDPARKWKLA